MFGIKFSSFDSMTYVIHYSKGKIKREGRGLSFFYYKPSSSLTAIPLGTRDVPFIFKETSEDFQEITVQGQITYNISDPKALSEALDFTVNANKRPRFEKFEVLEQRLNNEAQTAVSSYIQGKKLKEGLRCAQDISAIIQENLLNSKAVKLLGVQILSVEVLGVSPSPEMGKALETETREALQKEADQAVYERRNFAVEQERKIRESELNTEIAVKEKQKQIDKKTAELQLEKAQTEHKLRDMQIASDIEIEEKKKTLTDMQAENIKKQADAKGYELEKTLAPYKNLDWHILMAMNNNGLSAADNLGLAFRELAEKSEKIGNLNITPDLLKSLIDRDDE
ncbi:SPFH domain-containing protein [Treponema bryantii]|uniref:SPFH domain-containing protein n=1 Tax=Treponema bryantii TaxID=163 RepID=UPI002B2E19C8|nr:hypothetical protein TRBR_26050 [Treponema bryantii]